MQKNRKPTKRQMDAYEYIANYITIHGYPPTIKEVAGGLGISYRPAQRLIDALYLKGKIGKVPRSSRGIYIP